MRFIKWFVVGLLVLSSAKGQVKDFQATFEGNALEITWRTPSLNRAAPHYFPTLQVQISRDLNHWENRGDPITYNPSDQSEQIEVLKLVAPEWKSGESVFLRFIHSFDASGLDLSDVDFSDADLTGAEFSNADLSNAVFDGALLGKARFENTLLAGTSWQGTYLEGAVLEGVELSGLELYGNAVGSPEIETIGGSPEELLSDALTRIEYFARVGDYPGGYGGLEGFHVSPNTVLCLINPEMTVADLNNLLGTHEAVLVGSFPGVPGKSSFIILRTSTSSHDELDALLAILESDPGIKLVARDNLIDTFAVPQPTNAQDWDWTTNTGSNWGWQKIKAPQMWNVKEAVEKAMEKSGNPWPRTGIIDQGIGVADSATSPLEPILNTSYDDLEVVSNLTTFNLKELIQAGLDNARSAIPGLHGGHGIHVAGILGAKHNGKLIDGVNPWAQLVVKEMLGASTSAAEDGLEAWAKSSGKAMLDAFAAMVGNASVVNMSVGLNLDRVAFGEQLVIVQGAIEPVISAQGKEFAQLMLENSGLLVVTAAGNASQKLRGDDFNPTDVPAEFASPMNWARIVEKAPRILVVENLGKSGDRLGSSNVGGDIAAPGEAILSLARVGLQFSTGTSQSAPFVTGVASFLLSVHQGLSSDDLHKLILENAVGVDLPGTGEAPILDAWASLMAIDNYVEGNPVHRMLIDIDDGSLDGNTRLEVPDSPNNDRQFEPVTTGAVNEDEDVDGDGGMGDGFVDIKDFRRWRDWYLYAKKTNSLNGAESHEKHDLNRDGEKDGPSEGIVYPRGDFNGDGILDLTSVSKVTGVFSGDEVTDLDVLMGAEDLWSDDHYSVNDLPDLVDSVDIHLSAKNFFNKNKALGIGSGNVGVYKKSGNAVQYGMRLLSEGKPMDVVTVPAGMEYEVRSEPIPLSESRTVQMKSSKSFTPASSQQGGDYVVDLVLSEMSVETSLLDAGIELPESDPEVEEVESLIEAESGFSENPFAGSRAWANDKASLTAGVATGPLYDYQISLDTLQSHVIWQRSFTKLPGVPDPTFHIEPIRLKLIEGAATPEEQRAMVELRLEKRVGSGDWKSVFYTRTEIAGEVPNTGPHTYRIVEHQGDLPEQPLTILFDKLPGGSIFVFGAEYKQDSYDGTVDLANVEENRSFELRYTLESEAYSAMADELSQAFIGDPLKYAGGLSMEYGDFGEYFSIQKVVINSQGQAEVSHRSNPDYYFLLVRTVDDEGVAAAHGAEEPGLLIDENPAPGADESAYFVRGIPIGKPEDQDGDGMDDVYELQHPEILNPLDPSDAQEDPDNDGYSNLNEYERGLDPQVFDEGSPTGDESALFPGRLVAIGGRDNLRTADLDNNGRLDFLSRLGSSPAELFTALANPDGTFAGPVSTTISGSSFIVDIAVDFFDGDSFPDVALLDNGGKQLFIYHGAGNGSFTNPVTIPLGATPNRMALSDATGNGEIDILILFEIAKEVLILSRTEAGNWEEEDRQSFETSILDVAVGNFDGGKPDLAVTLLTGQVSVQLGGESGFGAPALLNTGFKPARVATGDLNGDEFDDIVTSNENSHDLSVMLSQGNGEFDPQESYPVGNRPREIAVKDISGDEYPDLIVSHLGSDFQSLLLGNEMGEFEEASPIYTAASDHEVVLGDWNGDNILDLAAIVSDSRAFIVDGQVNGSFSTRQQVDMPDTDIQDLVLSDLNDDGQLEVIVLNEEGPSVDLWTNGLSGEAPEMIDSESVPAEVVSLDVADIDGDGIMDVLAASKDPGLFADGTNQITLFKSENGTLIPAGDIPLDEAPFDVIAAELNGDTFADFLVYVSGKALPFVNDGTGNFTAGPPIVSGGIVTQVTTRDLDQDKMDEVVLVSVSGVDASLTIFGRETDGNYTENYSLDNRGSVSTLQWVDINGDDREDLLSVSTSGLTTTSTFSYYALENGFLTGPQEWFVMEEFIAGHVSAADLNQDGKSDLLINGEKLLLSDEESAEFIDKDYYSGGSKGLFLDMNEDGKQEIVSWNSGGSSVGILRQLETAFP